MREEHILTNILLHHSIIKLYLLLNLFLPCLLTAMLIVLITVLLIQFVENYVEILFNNDSFIIMKHIMKNIL